MKYLIILLLLSIPASAQNNSGTLVIAPIRPQAVNDTFPSAIANEIKGGPFSVGNIAAMSNIPSERLVAGALAYVTNDSSFRLYNGTNWSKDAVRDAIGLNGSVPLNLATGNIEDFGYGTTVDLATALYDPVESTWVMKFQSTDLVFNEEWRKTAFRTGLGLGWSALTNTNAATSLLGFNTNGQVVVNTGTNLLTFTNRPLIKGLNTTNIPAIQWDTSDGRGLGSIFALSKGAATNLWDSPTNAHTNWSILFLGQNITPNINGTDVAHPVQSMGSSYLTMENNYNFDGVSNAPASETYFVTRDTNNTLTRTFQILGSQTNSSYGSINMNYRLSIEPATATIENTGSPFVVRYSNPSAGNLPHAFFWNPDTNASRDVRLNMAVGNSPTAVMSIEPTKYFLFRGDYGYAFIARTNGIVIGSTGDVSPSERVHLAGNTRIDGAISFNSASNAAITRTNLGLGATNSVTFSNVSNNGNFTNNNGTIYGLKTNVGPFEGIGNFFASNNNTVGNETLFRVGLAEETNKSAQFGFRVARTNNGGEGLAVFSVFGYNALMMIGPSDRSRSNRISNTNAAIEADIWSMTETNRVMTLIDTNTAAMTMHRPIGFNTNNSAVLTSAPTNTNVTNPTGWIQIYVGTNSVRVPYYQ